LKTNRIVNWKNKAFLGFFIFMHGMAWTGSKDGTGGGGFRKKRVQIIEDE
jgi:hypothetical protein